MRVQPSTVADLATWPELPALAAEYAAESKADGLPPVVSDWESYDRAEKAGMLYVWSAVEDGRLIGFISLVVAPSPRYGVLVAQTESWFVTKARRGTGAGLRLFKLADEKSLELTGRHPQVNAPNDSDLAKVLPGLGYRPVATSFLKPVAHA
jgi:hypothetical protein